MYLVLDDLSTSRLTFPLHSSSRLVAQYEPGVLEACMNLLQVSPQHQKNSRRDYLKRNNPVYVGRVVSAMVGRVFTPKYTKRESAFCPTGLRCHCLLHALHALVAA